MFGCLGADPAGLQGRRAVPGDKAAIRRGFQCAITFATANIAPTMAMMLTTSVPRIRPKTRLRIPALTASIFGLQSQPGLAQLAEQIGDLGLQFGAQSDDLGLEFGA